MKTNLTPEQSQRLIELGVDPSNASDFEEVDVTDLTDPNAFIETEYHRIFDLSDILSLVPKRIDDLILTILGIGFDELAQKPKEGWTVSYVNEYMEAGSKDTIFQAPELIDALFELLCWVLQNHSD